MEHSIAPYNDSMQLGQGFDSFTQEAQNENAVCIDNLHRDASLTQARSSEARSQDTQGDALYECGSEASALTSATPTWSQCNEAMYTPSATDNGAASAPVIEKDRKSPIVTYTSRFVDNLSEVTTEMNISAAVPIIHQSRNGSGNGLPFDVRNFCESDLKYFLGVRVVTRQDRTGAAFSVPQPRDGADRFNNSIGDCFISGFLEGGQLNALVSVQLKDKKMSSEVSAALDSILKISRGKFLPRNDATETAPRMVTEHSKITVELWNVGGGSVTVDDCPYILESLRGVAESFSDRVAKKPEKIFAVLTKYDSLGRSSQVPTTSLCYDHCALYANALLDAFTEFKAIDRRLSAQISRIKSGTTQFQQQDYATADRKRRFDSSWRGITRAKRECTNQMLKILKEVEGIRKNPDVATDDTRDEQFEDPLVFSEYLPKVVPASSAAADHDPRVPQAQLWYGDETSLIPAELATAKRLARDHPNFAKQIRMGTPCGFPRAGDDFCSLDFVKPDWRLVNISVYVSKGVVSGIDFRYTNGLASFFGNTETQDRQFNLDLDLEAKEQIVGCSIETGKPASDTTAVIVTAVRLSTNRDSSLVAQPADWKDPVGGKSHPDGTVFESTAMTHYDPLLEGGYVHGFWGRYSPTVRGFSRLAPIWSNAAPTTQASFGTDDGLPAEDVTRRGCAISRQGRERQPYQPESNATIPCGQWDTWKIHDYKHPMPRTWEVLPYKNASPRRPLPEMFLGVQKIATWGGANMRFSATVDFVTDEKFGIGVDQWSDSVLYGGQFSWVGVRSDAPGIQGGKFEAHGPVVRHLKFAKPFSKPPEVLVWISGLDMDISAGKRVFVSATDTTADGFNVNVGSYAESALVQASVSWIAVDEDSSGCAVGSFGCLTAWDSHPDMIGACKLPRGLFSKPPKILAGFTAFDISGTPSNPRFGTNVSDVTAEGFNWQISTWSDSVISAAVVDWIAIPAEWRCGCACEEALDGGEAVKGTQDEAGLLLQRKL